MLDGPAQTLLQRNARLVADQLTRAAQVCQTVPDIALTGALVHRLDVMERIEAVLPDEMGKPPC